MSTSPSVPARIDHKDSAKAFVEWVSMPSEQREMTKKEFAETVNVSRNTLYNWQETPWFQQMVRHRVLTNLAEERGQVYDALVKQAKDGDIRAIELYADLLGDHVQQIDVTSGGESISEGDARQMTTKELADSLIRDKVQSEKFQKQLEEMDVGEEELLTLLIELLETTP